MWQACRPAGRLFCLVLAVALIVSGVQARGRGAGSARRAERAITASMAKPVAVAAMPRGVAPAPQGGPPLTSVVDTVYRADGTAAQGVLVITWPAFVEATGTAVSEGTLNVTLGANGALNVALAANAGATPAGVYYMVVYQLGPGQVRTEYWIVPTSSPATLAQVRATPGAGTATAGASVQYVNTQLASKANDNAVVHLAGSETVSGIKTFAVPPNAPTPVSTGDLANKSYVDTAIATVGAGNYLPTAGGAMTGPLTLSGSPTAPLQAAAKQYVDLTAASKADLISGLVPTRELGSGTASGSNCLLGSGAWGPCGSSANATAIQSVPVASSAPANGQVLTYSTGTGQYAPTTLTNGNGGVSVSPTSSQNIVQLPGTSLSVNNLLNIQYAVTANNWSQNPSGTLTAGVQATVTLTPCPVGIDGRDAIGIIYVSGTGTAEPVQLQGGGTCVSGAPAGGTIKFTPNYTHGAGYAIGSASSGIYESLAATTNMTGTNGTGNTYLVTGPAGTSAASGNVALMYKVHGTIHMPTNNVKWDAKGTVLDCYTRDACIQADSPAVGFGPLTLTGARMASELDVNGWPIASVQCTGGIATITTTVTHGILPGDLVDVQRTDASHFWGGSVAAGLTRVGTVTPTSVTYPDAGCGSGIPLTTTPGYINILNAAVLLNNNHDIVNDFDMSKPGGSALQIAGHFNNGITVLNDQAFSLTDFKPGVLSNGATDMCTPTNPYCGSMLYFPGPGSANATVAWLKNVDLSENCSGNGLTAFNGNTVIWDGGITQGFAQYGLSTGNRRGGFSNTILNDIYIEQSSSCTNPETPSCSPTSGCGNAMGVYSFGGSTRWTGGEGPQGVVPAFANGGSTTYYYYVVAIDSVLGASAPLAIGSAAPSGTTVNGFFPRVAPTNVLRSYTIIRTTDGVNAPTSASCLGGSSAACGSVATGVLQCATLECGFSDNVSVATSPVTITDPPAYTPDAMFWPGAVIVNGTSPAGCGNFTFDTNALLNGVVSLCGRAVPTVTTFRNPNSNFFRDAWVQAPYGLGDLKDDLNVSTSGLKGREIFERQNGQTVPSGEIITLVDSNPSKTQANSNKRPPADASDTFIGNDAAGAALNAAQLAFGAPVAISSYIGNLGDNASFLERLTATGKTFNVPVSVNGNLTVTGTCTGCGGGGGGSGTVNGATGLQLAMYPANGTAVSGDAALTDNGSTLNYTGSSGISATAGTFSGNVTVNGQLLVAGPWTVSSPIPGTAMPAAGAGTSALGISNDGNFYISANAGTPHKIATTASSSYFSNLFQEDASDVGQYTVGETAAQNLHVYSSYTNSSTWTRASLGYDATDNYAVVRSESSPSGGAPGLGFWINSGLKWVFDATGNLRPWTDQAYNLGSFNSAGSGSGVRPATLYVAGNSTSGSGLELGKFANLSYELCTDSTNGTVVNGLAVLTAAGCAAKPSSAATSGVIGIAIANAGTSGVVTLARTGSVYCSFDGTSTVIGDYVVPSSVASGGFFPLCHDAGAMRPTGTQILGRVLQTSSGSATVQMFLDMPGSSVSAASAGTGSCTNQAVTAVNTGAPTCTTITSAYVDSSIASTASPSLTGTPTAPTASAGDNSTKIATTAYVKSEAQFAWTCPLAGATAVSQNCNWTLPAGLTITGFDLAANTAPVGCTTFPVVQVWDGAGSGAEVGSYSIPLTSGSNFYGQVTGSTNLAAGHLLRVKVTTASAGCTTNAAGLVAIVTYQMQN